MNMLKKNAALIVAAVLFAAAAVFVFYYSKENAAPKQLVLQAIKAAQKGDLKAFEKAVDINSIADYIVTNAYDLAFNENTKGAYMLKQMEPDLKLSIAMQIKELVKDPQKRDLLLPWQRNLTFLERLWAETFGTDDLVYNIKLKQTEDLPYVELQLRFPEQPDKIFPLVIGFKETSKGLKLATLPNIAPFLTDLEPLRAEREKFYKARIEESINQSLKTLASASISEGSWGKGRNVFVNLSLENTSDKDILQVSGSIFLMRGVQKIGSLSVNDTDALAPKDISEKTYNLHFEPLSDGAALIEAALKGNLGVTAKFKVKQILFTDGTELKL